VPAPLASPLSSDASLYSLHTGQLTVTYAPDVFGGVQRQVERAAALAEGERFQLEATYLTLAANVVAAAIEEASLRAQIAALEEVAALEREQVRLMQRQFELGEIARSNVTAQRGLLAQTEAALVPLRKRLALQRNLLTALAGRLPQDEVEEQFAFAEIQLPVELPVSLPSSLVRQRPDVRAAEARLHAASAEIGVATANMLPQLRLTADIGAVATSLLSGGAGFWMLAAGVTQPVFQGGALEHRKLAAEAAYDEAFARYRSTVVGAFRGVADALRALQFDAEALTTALDAKTLAEENLRSARRERAAGDISTLALLGAEQAYRQTIVALIQAQASRYADTAALFQALGGGWWNRAPR
jgi:NodT family efflux transporter outer membrane factor (OMF) lipoprotein